jgi:hypothetical protein
MMMGVTYHEITDKGLPLTTKTGQTLTMTIDTIIPATPMSPNSIIEQALKKVVPEVYAIGDCKGHD